MKLSTIILPTAAALALAVFSTPSHAQLDGGTFAIDLYENGKLVGEVYVPDRAPGQTQYYEDWVLFPDYQYPGPRFVGTLKIIADPTKRPYTSESDFFKNVPFAPGSKFVRVFSQESTSLPALR